MGVAKSAKEPVVVEVLGAILRIGRLIRVTKLIENLKKIIKIKLSCENSVIDSSVYYVLNFTLLWYIKNIT
jgi:hypothetical protein